MPRSVPTVSAATITESILKRKWTSTILRQFALGIVDPEDVRRREPDLTASVFNQRLRTLQRYGLVARFPRPSSSAQSEFRITALGRKIINLLDQIDEVDRELVRLQQQALERQRRHLQ